MVSLSGKIHLFDSTFTFRIDTLSFDGTNLSGKIRADGPLNILLVPGSNLVTIRMDSLRGTFSTGNPDITFYGGFGIQISSGTCGGNLTFRITGSGINLENFESNCDPNLSDLDLGWVHLGFKNLGITTLSYNPGSGWDFNVGMDIKISFPYLDSLESPWISGITLGTDGFHFPTTNLDLSSLPLPTIDLGGFGLKPLAFSMGDMVFPWFSWSGGAPTGLSFSFSFDFQLPNLPESFPECIRTPDIRLNDVEINEGNFSFDLPVKLIEPPGCRIPLGGDVYFNILRLSGSFSAAYRDGNLDVDGGVDISGNLSLPSILMCEGGEGNIDLTSYTLHFDSNGHITGSINDIVPSCPLRFGPFSITISRSNLNFNVVDGEQQVVLDLSGTLKLPAPTPNDTVEAAGNLVLELTHFRLIDGSLRITEPFVWNIPSTNPVMSIRIDSALIDTEGFHIDGSGTLLLAEGYSVGVNFDHLVLDLSDFNVKSGSANFTSSFAFKIDMSGEGMVWSAVRAGTELLGQGIMLNLPENIQLVQGGISITDTSEVEIIWGEETYNVRAVFSDDFILSWTPEFGVSQGRVDFYINERRVAWLDEHGFHPDFTGIVPIPAKLPIPDTNIAYIKLKENDSLLIHYSYEGNNLRIYTESGKPVYVYIPALKMGDFVPNFGVEFDVTVNPTSFEFVDGEIHARPPRGVDTLFTLTGLGIPLKVEGFDYVNREGVYGALIDASFKLPEILDSLEIKFDSLEITTAGLSGRASVGNVYDTLALSGTYIDSIVLGDFITIKINGGEITFSPLNARFSGDIVPNFFEDNTGVKFPVHFVASLGTEGVDFDFDYPDSLPISLAYFSLLGMDGHPPIDISVGDTFYIELSGVLSLPFLSDSVRISLTGLKIMNVEPYVVCPTISYRPSPEQFFKLFGAQFGLMDISRDGRTYPALSFSYRDGAFAISMSGQFEFLNDTITFTNLTVDTKGHFSFDYINLLSHPDTLVDPYWVLDTILIKPDSLIVGGYVNLPPPLNEAGNQRYRFTVGFDGTIRGGTNIRIIDETPSYGGDDPTEFDFFIGKLDINYLALDLDLSDIENSGISGIFYFYFDASKVVKFGNKDERNIEPGFTIHFNGDIDWGDIDIPEGTIPDIDWEIFRMRITGVSLFDENGIGISLSGNLGLKVSSVEGSIEFSNFGISSDGHIDFPDIGQAELTIANILTLSINEIAYSDKDTTIEVPQITLPTKSDSGGSTTRSVSVSSYFTFGLTITFNISGAGGGGGVEKFVAYTKPDGTPGFVIKRATLEVSQVFSAELNMEFEGGENYRFLFVGNASIPAVNNTSLLLIGKLAHTERGPSFGAFLSVSTRIDIIPGMVILSGVGGGFFYNPDTSDIKLVKYKSGLSGMPFDTMSVQPAKFAVFLYASAEIVSDWAAKGQTLLTVTNNEFTLDAKVVLLHMKDKIEGYAHLGIGFSDFYAVGNIGVEVNIVELITGRGTFDFYVYDTDAWGVMGGVDIKLFTIIDLESDFFIGPPGFMLSSSAKFGFDIWIISISAGFEGDIWYIRDVSWGAYFEAYVSAEVIDGVAGAKGWLKACLLVQPQFYLYGVAGLSAHFLFFSWDASVWAKLSSDGIDGGFGSDPEMEELIDQAREAAHEMEEAKEAAQEAIAAAQVAITMLSPEEQAQIFYTVFTDQFRINGVPLYRYLRNIESNYGGMTDYERVRFNYIANYVYRGEASPYGDTLDIVSIKDSLNQLVNRLETIRWRVNTIIGELNIIVDSVQQVGLTDIGDNPVENKQISPSALDVVISNGHATVNSTPDFSINEATLNENRANAEEYQRQAQRLYFQISQRIYQVEQAIRDINDMLSEGVVDTFLKTYSLADLQNAKYFSYLIDYIKRFRTWAVAKQSVVRNYHDNIWNAVHGKTQRLARSNMEILRTLVRQRKQAEYYILFRGNQQQADSAYNEFLNAISSFSDDQWIDLCDSTGMEIWYNIPLTGLAYMDSIFGVNLDSAYAYYERSIDSIGGPHVQVTEAIDRIYNVTSQLGEVLYDLYDRMIFWLQGAESDTITPPMTGNSGIVYFHNGSRVVLRRFPSIGAGVRTYGDLLVEYREKKDTLAYLLTPPHIRRLGAWIQNWGHYDKGIFNWSYHHPSGIGDISYKIVPPRRSRYLVKFKSMGKSSLEYGGVRNRYQYYFFQRYNETEDHYTFCLRLRTPLGYSQTRCVPFTVYYEGGGGGRGHAHSFEMPADTSPPFIYRFRLPGLRRKVIGPHRTSRAFYTAVTSQLYMEWDAQDPESDVEEYQYMIERIYYRYTFDPVTRRFTYISLSDTILPWTSAHGMTRVTVRGLNLRHNNTYRIALKARNGAGLWSEPVFRYVRVDTTPPPPPSRFTGYYMVPPMAFLSPPIPPRIYHKFVVNDDPESQVFYLLYKVDTIPHYHYDGTQWDTIPRNRDYVNIVGEPLHYLDTFYVSIVAVNITNQISDTAYVSPPLVPHDPTPPTNFRFDITSSPVYGWFIRGCDSLIIHFSTLSDDPETGIKHYLFGIGSTVYNPDISGFTPIRPDEINSRGIVIARFDTSAISDGDTLFFIMKVVNFEGLERRAVEGPYILDKSPPPRPAIHQVRYDRSSNNLHIEFTYSDDPQSGIRAVGYEILDNKGNTIREFTRIHGVSPGDNSVTVHLHGSSLTPGNYFLHLVVRNRVHLQSIDEYSLEVKP